MAQPPISRGFRGRKPATQSDRIPPGQHLTHDFPVLSAGPTPHVSLADWSFSLDSGGKVLKEWSWEEFNALPQTELKTDIHCVTTWSKLDTHWRGVTIDDLLKAAGLVRAAGRFHHGALRRRLHHQRSGRRSRRRQGHGGHAL